MDTEQHITTTESSLIKLCDNSEEKGEKRILLKVQGCGNEVYYWMSRNTLLRQLMINYTQRIGVSFNSARFLYDDEVIKPAFSANRLNLEDEDLIDVVPRDGFVATAGTESTLISLPRSKEEMPIFLLVREGFGMCREKFYYQIGRNTPLKVLLFDYADRIGELVDDITLTYGFDHIDINKTADELGCEDGDNVFASFNTRYILETGGRAT